MTAAHSTGTVVLASILQLASMAARSMVRRPPASVGSVASAAALAVRRSGSWTVMIETYGGAVPARLVLASSQERQPHVVAVGAGGRGASRGAGSRAPALRSHWFRHLIVAREVIEARDGRVELDIDGTGRAVALLADDDLGLAVHGGHLPCHLVYSSVPGRGSLLLR